MTYTTDKNKMFYVFFKNLKTPLNAMTDALSVPMPKRVLLLEATLNKEKLFGVDFASSPSRSRRPRKPHIFFPY